MKEIEVKRIEIFNKGDATVGIFPSSHEITGPMFFESKKELEEFMIELRNAFESIMDEPRAKAEIVEENESYVYFCK